MNLLKASQQQRNEAKLKKEAAYKERHYNLWTQELVAIDTAIKELEEKRKLIILSMELDNKTISV